MPSTKIPARTGDYVSLKSGQRLKLTNPAGNQVIDFWAFVFTSNTTTSVPTSFVRSPDTHATAEDASPYPFRTGIQYFSASRTRSILSKLIPSAESQDTLYTNKSLPLFSLLEDTTSGIHDTLFGCCDRFRYHNLGIGDYEHASCAENMHVALHRAAAAGVFSPGLISLEWTPDPLNIFMNVPVTTPLDRKLGGGSIRCDPPVSNAGEYIVLRAKVDCVAVMSACPNDVIGDVNGGNCTEIEYEVLS